MAAFVKGDVVVVPFPFSDLSSAKRRPALVLAALEGDDVILCQITSKDINDSYAVMVDDSDFEDGGLQQISNIRPNKIFTADKHIILYRLGSLNIETNKKVTEKIVSIFQNKEPA